MPFWRQTLNLPLACLIVLRDPAEVVESLWSRPDRFPRDKGMALWERSMRSVLRDSAGMPAFVTCYEHLLAHPQTWSQEVGTFLEARGAQLSPQLDALRAFVEPGLRHHAADKISETSLLSPQQADLWRLLLQLEGAHDNLPALPLPPESPSTPSLLGGDHESSSKSLFEFVRRPLP